VKAPIGKNIEKILEENKYDYFVFRSATIPERLRKVGFDVEAVIDGAELKYFYKGKDITKHINDAIDLGKLASNKSKEVVPATVVT